MSARPGTVWDYGGSELAPILPQRLPPFLHFSHTTLSVTCVTLPRQSRPVVAARFREGRQAHKMSLHAGSVGANHQSAQGGRHTTPAKSGVVASRRYDS